MDNQIHNPGVGRGDMDKNMDGQRVGWTDHSTGEKACLPTTEQARSNNILNTYQHRKHNSVYVIHPDNSSVCVCVEGGGVSVSKTTCQ